MIDPQAQCCAATPPTRAQRVRDFIVGRFSVAGWHLKLLFLRLAYRHIMRLSHYFGWHYAPVRGPMPDGESYRWCQWCGLRGTVFDPSKGPLRSSRGAAPHEGETNG
jgi:hypothetical protein